MTVQSGPYGFLGDTLSTLDKANLLRSVPLLADIDDNYLLAIARHGRDVRVNPGDVLVHQGDAGNELMLLLEGHVKVQQGDRTLSSMHPGEYFGEVAMLDGQPRSADVVAATAARVLTMDHATFHQILTSEPSLSQKIIVNLCRMIRSKSPITE